MLRVVAVSGLCSLVLRQITFCQAYCGNCWQCRNLQANIKINRHSIQNVPTLLSEKRRQIETLALHRSKLITPTTIQSMDSHQSLQSITPLEKSTGLKQSKRPPPFQTLQIRSNQKTHQSFFGEQPCRCYQNSQPDTVVVSEIKNSLDEDGGSQVKLNLS